VRFPNEIKAIHNAGGLTVRIRRGDDPEWYDAAVSANRGPEGNISWATSRRKLEKLEIHASETAWVGGKIDHTVYNDSGIDDLFNQIKSLVEDRLASTAS
jgi:hypothetical protein